MTNSTILGNLGQARLRTSLLHPKTFAPKTMGQLGAILNGQVSKGFLKPDTLDLTGLGTTQGLLEFVKANASAGFGNLTTIKISTTEASAPEILEALSILANREASLVTRTLEISHEARILKQDAQAILDNIPNAWNIKLNSVTVSRSPALAAPSQAPALAAPSQAPVLAAPSPAAVVVANVNGTVTLTNENLASYVTNTSLQADSSVKTLDASGINPKTLIDLLSRGFVSANLDKLVFLLPSGDEFNQINGAVATLNSGTQIEPVYGSLTPDQIKARLLDSRTHFPFAITSRPALDAFLQALPGGEITALTKQPKLLSDGNPAAIDLSKLGAATAAPTTSPTTTSPTTASTTASTTTASPAAAPNYNDVINRLRSSDLQVATLIDNVGIADSIPLAEVVGHINQYYGDNSLAAEGEFQRKIANLIGKKDSTPLKVLINLHSGKAEEIGQLVSDPALLIKLLEHKDPQVGTYVVGLIEKATGKSAGSYQTLIDNINNASGSDAAKIRKAKIEAAESFIAEISKDTDSAIQAQKFSAKDGDEAIDKLKGIVKAVLTEANAANHEITEVEDLIDTFQIS